MLTRPKNNSAARTLRIVAAEKLRKISGLLVAAGLLALTVGVSATFADDEVGAVRITDQKVARVSNSEAMPNPAAECLPGNATGAPVMMDGGTGPVLHLTGNPVSDWYRVHRFEHRMADGHCENDCDDCGGCCLGHCRLCGRLGHAPCDGDCDDCSECCLSRYGLCRHCCLCGGKDECDANGHPRKKRQHFLGCLCPIGPEPGYGCRFLDIHGYHMVYAVNPGYFDRRDGQVYAAQGWGAPMAVPLAPTVGNQFNYGWGIPSSRITPISRLAPQPGVIPGAVAPQ